MSIYELADRIGNFCNSTAGWCVTALLIGVIITALVWMKKHPEDFFWYETDEDDIELPCGEEIDHI